MVQALSFCNGCETPRCCDNCTDLHNWIVDALEEKAELQAYRDTGLSPEEVKDMAENAETRCLTWFESRYGFPAGELMWILKAKQDGRLAVLGGDDDE